MPTHAARHPVEVLLTMLAFLAASGTVGAQVTGSVSVQTPGSLRQVGQGASSRFRAKSYGLGSVGRSSSGRDSGVLRSSIGSLSSYTVQRRPAARPSEATVSLSTAGGGPLSYTTVSSNIGTPYYHGSTGLAKIIDVAKSQPLAYLAGADETVGTLSEDRTEPITSLVPNEPGMQQVFMEKGEKAFRQGHFSEAYQSFKLANYGDPRGSESLLSMAHARFASQGFLSASFYLRQALRYCPELPVVPLRPKGFFGDPEDYESALSALKDRVRGSPSADALLLLAYFSWFAEPQDVETATDAISRGLALADKPDIVEALKTFQDAMAAAGAAAKASGSELPPSTTQTPPESGPASPAPAAPTRPAAAKTPAS